VYETLMSLTVDQLAQRIDVRVEGDGAALVRGCASIETAQSDEITFVANSKYMRFLATTCAAAVLVTPDTPCPDTVTRLVSDDPYFAFRNAMVELHGMRRHPSPIDGDAEGISPRAAIHPEAEIGPDTQVHPFATVEAGARVGAESILYPNSYVGPSAVLGAGCVLFPGAVVYDYCVLGDRVTLHANVVVGHDGFGYATHDGAHHKIPQSGRVVIGDDVEIGAGCAIERAAMGETKIGTGTKFADLISIGHGTTVGAHCLFVSLTGVSGSVDVGNHVVLGGQVGVSGHLRIGDGVQAMARTGIARDIAPGQRIGGAPAVPFDDAKRNMMAARHLDVLVKRVRALERQMALLTSDRDATAP
jgi:UDP-3-O-[3-hydroxymyristoyl] glucosamine N-acyltransferase